MAQENFHFCVYKHKTTFTTETKQSKAMICHQRELVTQYFLLHKCLLGAVHSSAKQSDKAQLRMFSKECHSVDALAFV